MNYSFKSDLGWREGVSTTHSLRLSLDVGIADFLRGKNITETLVNTQNLIRKEIQRVVLEEILPQVFSKVGAAPPDGTLRAEQHAEIAGDATTTELRTPAGIEVLMHDRISVELNISTDRAVTALQALYASRLFVADVVTNNIMIHLSDQYLGTTEHHIKTHSTVKNGELDHRADHKGNSAERN